jgi:uncharacterized protein (TIGR02453 family)
MTFKGWPESALTFYEGLEADNSRSYWLEHNDTYERAVKAPMEALLADLEDEFGKSRLYRPYRDTRFSQNKSPYKTAIAARLGGRGHYHVQLSAAGLLAGVGDYAMTPDQLSRFRDAVVADSSGKQLQVIMDTLTDSGLDVHGRVGARVGAGASVETLKTAPKGYPKEHPRIELLRMKGLVASRTWEPAAWFHTAGAEKRVVAVFRAAQPLLAWYDTHVGPGAGSRNGS